MTAATSPTSSNRRAAVRLALGHEPVERVALAGDDRPQPRRRRPRRYESCEEPSSGRYLIAVTRRCRSSRRTPGSSAPLPYRDASAERGERRERDPLRLAEALERRPGGGVDARDRRRASPRSSSSRGSPSAVSPPARAPGSSCGPPLRRVARVCPRGPDALCRIRPAVHLPAHPAQPAEPGHKGVEEDHLTPLRARDPLRRLVAAHQAVVLVIRFCSEETSSVSSSRYVFVWPTGRG